MIRNLKLKTRLLLLSTVLTLFSMGLGLVIQVVMGKSRIASESSSAVDLAWQLVDSLLSSTYTEGEVHEAGELLHRLQNIEAVRHLDIRIISATGETLASTSSLNDEMAPVWFATLVAVPAVERSKALGSPPGAMLLVRSSTEDEVAETWHETRNFLGVLALLLLGFNTVLHVMLNRWLAPVRQIVQSIDRTGSGDFSGKVPNASLPELRTIASRLNQLNISLHDTQVENEKLAAQALKIQEAERHFLAQELHDALGQALSAIKAIAWSLQQQAAGKDERFAQGAAKVSVMAADMSGHVRTMLEKLRPSILDEMGLVAAVTAMVREWNDTYSNCVCLFTPALAFDAIAPVLHIHVYRIVQAALTNVADHAEATQVEVVMAVEEDCFLLKIKDNGKGIDTLVPRRGRGLVTMRERAQVLGGSMQIVNAAVGTELKFVFPRKAV